MKRSSRKPDFKSLIAEHGYNTKWYKLYCKMEWVFINEDKCSLRRWLKKHKQRRGVKTLRIINKIKSHHEQ